MRNSSKELHQLCSALEEKNVYFHKIDKDNLNSKDDVNFIKRTQVKKHRDLDQEEFGVYLFSLKIQPETITEVLLNNGNLLQSVISKHRCTFCFKQCSKKKKEKCKHKRDPLPICKSCVSKGFLK